MWYCISPTFRDSWFPSTMGIRYKILRKYQTYITEKIDKVRLAMLISIDELTIRLVMIWSWKCFHPASSWIMEYLVLVSVPVHLSKIVGSISKILRWPTKLVLMESSRHNVLTCPNSWSMERLEMLNQNPNYYTLRLNRSDMFKANYFTVTHVAYGLPLVSWENKTEKWGDNILYSNINYIIRFHVLNLWSCENNWRTWK